MKSGGICGGWSGIGLEFCPSVALFFCQYHSTDAPYTFFDQSTTLLMWAIDREEKRAKETIYEDKNKEFSILLHWQ